MNWIIVIVAGIIAICVSHWFDGKIGSSLCLFAVETISIIAISRNPAFCQRLCGVAAKAVHTDRRAACAAEAEDEYPAGVDKVRLSRHRQKTGALYPRFAKRARAKRCNGQSVSDRIQPGGRLLFDDETGGQVALSQGCAVPH